MSNVVHLQDWSNRWMAGEVVVTEYWEGGPGSVWRVEDPDHMDRPITVARFTTEHEARAFATAWNARHRQPVIA